MQLWCNPLLANLIKDRKLLFSWDGDEKKSVLFVVAIQQMGGV